MKNPHDISDYVRPDDDAINADKTADAKAPQDLAPKSKLSGAYYYVDADERKLAEASFNRTTLTVIALLLQIITLMFPQRGLKFVAEHYPSYAYFYAMFTIVGLFGVSIWLFVMIALRYKIAKRIPVERAPRGGFLHRAYFGSELYIAINAAMFVFELSFVCISCDGWGLGAMFVSLAAAAAAVWARQINNTALRSAVLVPSEKKNEK